MDYYDLSIIGAGWAGFTAATQAAQLGLKVVLIEKRSIGGTCLNYGCIPTKSLIQSAKIYSLSKKSSRFGISPERININFNEIQNRKEKIIGQLQTAMQSTLKNKNITYINAQAKIESNTEVSIGKDSIKSKHILIATGSRPMELPALRFDGKKILSSNEILDLREIPRSILIVGGGVIGCEFASLFNILGSKVNIVELLPNLLPQEDKEISKKLETIFKKSGLQVNTDTDAKKTNLNDYEKVLVCIGRRPYTDELNLDKIGIKLEKDRIVVDDYLKTSISNIYAAGDCTGEIMLAHFAAFQGGKVAQNIAHPDKSTKYNEAAVPNCIFTTPEVSRVGLTEEEAKSKDREFQINKFDFLGSGMARIMDEAEGFIKIIVDKKTGQILGASIIGPQAVELIAVLTLAIQNKLKISQVRSTIFAHPTLSESIGEALK